MEKQTDEYWERSGGMCENILPDGSRCYAPAAERHHEPPKGMAGRNKDSRIIVLCLNCHRKRHGG